MKYEIGFVDNPRFESISGLTNTTFDPDDYREDRMATEAQVLAAWNATNDLELEGERCCKKMQVWETYVQIVRLNTNTLDANGQSRDGGVVVSPFHRNRRSGILREEDIYTVTFALPFDSGIYAPYTLIAGADGLVYAASATNDQKNGKLVQYRLMYDDQIQLPKASAGANVNTRRSGFFGFVNYNNSGAATYGRIINNLNNWGSFVHNIGDDGIVSITDSVRETNFTVVRYYTQWTLRECANGSLLPDPT